MEKLLAAIEKANREIPPGSIWTDKRGIPFKVTSLGIDGERGASVVIFDCIGEKPENKNPLPMIMLMGTFLDNMKREKDN